MGPVDLGNIATDSSFGPDVKIPRFRYSSVSSNSNSSEVTRSQITAADIHKLPLGGQDKFDLLEEIGQGTYGLVHRLENYNVIFMQYILSMLTFSSNNIISEQLKSHQTSHMRLRSLKTMKRTSKIYSRNTRFYLSTASIPTFRCCLEPTGEYPLLL